MCAMCHLVPISIISLTSTCNRADHSCLRCCSSGAALCFRSSTILAAAACIVTAAIGQGPKKPKTAVCPFKVGCLSVKKRKLFVLIVVFVCLSVLSPDYKLEWTMLPPPDQHFQDAPVFRLIDDGRTLVCSGGRERKLGNLVHNGEEEAEEEAEEGPLLTGEWRLALSVASSKWQYVEHCSALDADALLIEV